MRSPRPDLGELHPFNDAIVGIYLAGKEQAMHVRAQRAEGLLCRERRTHAAELAVLERRLRTQTNREKSQRKRANRLARWADVAAYQLRENERLKRQRDPLYRIIALGRDFP